MAISGSSPRIAIVGAGMSGLACAGHLRNHGIDVTVFDKARGTGGRAATHRNGGHTFDSGAQYFTARDPLFVAQVARWEAVGAAAEWTGETVWLRAGQATPGGSTTRRFVGVPGMSAISRHLASECEVRTGFGVAGLDRGGDGLALVGHDGQRECGFDSVLLSAPAPQTAAIARSAAPELAAVAAQVPFSTCLALMLTFPERLLLPFDGAFVDDSPLSWIARDGSKPGRSSAETWVLHGAPGWSDANFAAADERIGSSLREAFTRATGVTMPDPLYSRLHRWRYALPTEPLPDRCLFDAASGVGACGDWCGGPRVEGAFLSGIALADRVVQWLPEGAASPIGRELHPPRSPRRKPCHESASHNCRPRSRPGHQ